MPPRRRSRQDDLTSTGRVPETEMGTASERGERRVRRGRRVSADRPRPRWMRRLGLGLLLLLGLILVGPNLVGWFGLQQLAVDWALADLDGRVEVQQLTLGWFQPVTLRGIRVADGTGQPLAEVESIRSTKRLVSFLLSRDLGDFEIHQPRLQLKVRPGGSNLEDALARYLKQPPAEPAVDLPSMRFSIREGSVQVTGALSNEVAQVDQVQAMIATSTPQAAIEAELAGRIAETGRQGEFRLQLQLDAGKRQIQLGDGRLDFSAQQLSLTGLGPVLQRMFAQVQAGGELNGQAQIQFQDGGQSLAASFEKLHLHEAFFLAPSLLGSDRIQFQSLTMDGQARATSNLLIAENLVADCDLGRAAANGKFAWQELSGLATGGQLSREPFQVEGKLDLARLASLFPATLRVYDDVQFESGELQFQLLSKPSAEGGRLLLNVDTTHVVAHRGGQRLAWQQPLRLVADLTDQSGALRLEELTCRTDFLTVTGKADRQRGQFELSGDLARLLERAGQFADLSGWQLAGDLKGQWNWDLINAPDGSAASGIATLQPLAWEGVCTLSNPVIGIPAMPVWREAQLEVSGRGTVQLQGSQHVALPAGSLAVRVGAELAELKLREPVEDLFQQRRWVADYALTGGLAHWLRHLRTFVDLGSFSAEGQTQLRGVAVYQSSQLQLENLDYDIQQLEFVGYGMHIQEPQIKGLAQLQVDLDRGQLRIQDMTLASSSLAARGERILLEATPAIQMTGAVGFRADVNRVSNWFGISPAADSVHYFGTAEGSLELSSDPQALFAQISAQVPELIAAQSVTLENSTAPPRAEWRELLKEPNVRLTGRIGLSQDFDRLSLQAISLQSSSMNVQTEGTLSDLSDSFRLDLTGKWSPNWEQVNGLLAAYSSNWVQLNGSREQAFQIRGPLFGAAGETQASFFPAELEMESKLGWESGKIGPLPLGPAELQLKLASGIAELQSGPIPFSGGIVRVAPRVDFRSPAPVVLVPSGPLAENITLSPEICRDWLKYVAPLLADVTSAQGAIGLDSEGLQLPIADPLAARIKGQIKLHNVTVGAGPLATQLIESVQGIRALLRPAEGESKDLKVWMKLEEQTVPFTVQDRRVYHEGLTMSVKDITIRTKGSVGFDQSLSMVAEIPISDGWLGTEPWLQGLKGQSLQIPVGGTVTRPVLDKQAIQQLSMQLVQRTAANQLNTVVGDQAQKLQSKVDGQLNKLQNDLRDKLPGDFQQGLDKLFGPPKKDKQP